jgi:hypothetical protein
VGTPTGSISWTVNGKKRPAVAVRGGKATLALKKLKKGKYTVVASYRPKGKFAACRSKKLVQRIT